MDSLRKPLPRKIRYSRTFGQAVSWSICRDLVVSAGVSRRFPSPEDGTASRVTFSVLAVADVSRIEHTGLHGRVTERGESVEGRLEVEMRQVSDRVMAKRKED